MLLRFIDRSLIFKELKETIQSFAHSNIAGKSYPREPASSIWSKRSVIDGSVICIDTNITNKVKLIWEVIDEHKEKNGTKDRVRRYQERGKELTI